MIQTCGPADGRLLARRRRRSEQVQDRGEQTGYQGSNWHKQIRSEDESFVREISEPSDVRAGNSYRWILFVNVKQFA